VSEQMKFTWKAAVSCKKKIKNKLWAQLDEEDEFPSQLHV